MARKIAVALEAKGIRALIATGAHPMEMETFPDESCDSRMVGGAAVEESSRARQHGAP